MGKTIRWLKGLFGFKKESNSGDRKNKIPSCISGLSGGATDSLEESPLMKSVYNNNYEDQNRRAIAVAKATATAADAAVAAAQAAVAFVRITSQNRIAAVSDRKNSSAIKIQRVFRGYLARKALKALKSLVKLQAVVRGYLVRKETIQTLNGMEALFRARVSVCEQRNRLQDDKFQSKRSFRRASETKSRRMSSSSFRIRVDEKPNPIDLDFEKPKSRLTRANTWAWAIDQTPSPIFTNSHRISIPNLSTPYEFDPHFSTTHNTPRFTYTCGPNDYHPIYERVSKDDTFTSDPNYMAKTKSFRAKVRSHSAPKQRPDYGFGLRQRAGLTEVECGPRVEKLKSKSPSMLENSFKNLLMSRIGKSKGQ